MRSAFIMLLFFTLLTGFVYPVFITGLSKVFFPKQSEGSLIKIDKKIIGSELLAQDHSSDPSLFWSRPSYSNYSTLPGGASNLSPTSKTLHKIVLERKQFFKSPDLIFYSASGLDPHLSLEAVLEQVPRVSQAKNVSQEKLINLIHQSIENPTLGFMGRARINILKLNLALKEY